MASNESSSVGVRVRCECGATLLITPELFGKALVCAQCGGKVSPLPQSAAAAVSTRVSSHAEGAICPICQSAIAPAEAVVTCSDCDQVHHQDCWSEIGGCATYGCKQAPAAVKSDQVAPERRSAWGDTKKCPACGEVIKAIALRCRYCKTDFDSVEPMTTTDLRKQAISGDKVANMKRNVAILFGISLLGLPAPICFPVSLAYVLPRRELLAKCGPLFVIMGWTAIILSGLYSLLMLVVSLLSLG